MCYVDVTIAPDAMHVNDPRENGCISQWGRNRHPESAKGPVLVVATTGMLHCVGAAPAKGEQHDGVAPPI